MFHHASSCMTEGELEVCMAEGESGKRTRLVSEATIPKCRLKGKLIATGAPPISVAPAWETLKIQCLRSTTNQSTTVESSLPLPPSASGW
jgi:hypothetical protein